MPGLRLAIGCPAKDGLLGDASQVLRIARHGTTETKLATLFDDEAEVDRWLAEMPLLAEEIAIEIPGER